MLVSAREACRILAEAGASQRCALQVLASGLAGESVHGGTVTLYEDAKVWDLARRPRAPWSDAVRLCPAGFFVSRRGVRATASRDVQLAGLREGWGAVSVWRWIAVGHQIQVHGSFPFVATVGGLVVLGADIAVGPAPGTAQT